MRGVIECVIEEAVPSRQRACFLRREADVVTFDARVEAAERLEHLPERAEMIRRRRGDDDQLRIHVSSQCRARPPSSACCAATTAESTSPASSTSRRRTCGAGRRSSSITPRCNALEPRFTMVTPAFNHEAIIAAAIDATAATASLPFDCIIVDDGSTDRTVARARSVFESRRVTAHRQGHHHPQSRADLRDRLRQPGVRAGRHRDHRRSSGGHSDPRAGVRRAVPARPRHLAHAVARCRVDVDTPSRRSAAAPASDRSSVERHPQSIGLCGKTIDTPEIVEPDPRADVPMRNRESGSVGPAQERSRTARLPRRAAFLSGQ